ncbi:MAG: hypothetical protein JXR04_13045 [Bermanella sp.]
MKKILSCCPVASIETMNLIPANFQFQPGKPVSAFQANVWWIQESEASVCMRDHKQRIHHLNRYTDREGYLSSIDQAIRECIHLTRGYNLSISSLESVFIEMNIIQTPVFELFSQEIKFSWDRHTNWRQYEVVSNEWSQLQYPDKPISPHNVVRPVKDKKILGQKVIWHSNQSMNDAMAYVKEFKLEWALQDNKKITSNQNKVTKLTPKE